MKESRESRRPEQSIQTWSFEQARSALAYVASIMRSLREHRLEGKSLLRRARALEARPGRPDRRLLIAQADAERRAREALDRYQEAKAELNALGIFCLDAIRGEAVIPFLHDDQLAWFIFDLFDPGEIQFWRYHSDPSETRRPIADIPEAVMPTALA